jgi:hypothetical protein
MATRIAWWLNLDANLELEEPERYARRAGLDARVRALAARLSTLLSPDDVVLDGTRDARALGVNTALAFCPTPSAVRALARLGFASAPHPSLAVLRSVTRRSFAAGLGQCLPGARYIDNLGELEAALQTPSCSGEWLLKRDFSFAGRERRRVRGGRLDPPTLGFVKRSFARGQGLSLEPCLERDADFAQHGFLLASGELLLGPAMLQHCDARGVWQASTSLPAGALSAAEAAALCDSVRGAGAALREAGYFGPYGVDAFRYRHAGRLAFQPRCEINPRFTMGYPRALLDQVLGLSGAG